MVLLGRRGGGSFAGGTWCLPCGFVEHDEDVLTAAKREVLEETGLTIELLSIIQVTSNFLSPDLHSVVTVFHARVKSGHPRPGDDIDKVEWFQLNGPFPPFAFEADREIIERFSLASKPGLSLEESLR
jgi:ADP-ribose pyrophosphatase YjhB (NUDIX family)